MINSTKYGPPLPRNTIVQPLYGVVTVSGQVGSFVGLITSPILVVISFIIGILLFLKTHKKKFILIPIIWGILYVIRRAVEKIFGIYLGG